MCVPIIDGILVALELQADNAFILSNWADNFCTLQVVVAGVFYTIFVIRFLKVEKKRVEGSGIRQ